MQSKTSFFNGRIYRTTLARFWPLWGAYAMIMFIITTLPMTISLTDNEISDSTVGSIAIDKDGQKFTLSAKGDLYDVKLSAIEFNESADDFTENGAYLYFSALADGQSIGVQSVIPEVMPNLMISWRNADGTASRRLISQSGKDGSMVPK